MLRYYLSKTELCCTNYKKLMKQIFTEVFIKFKIAGVFLFFQTEDFDF